MRTAALKLFRDNRDFRTLFAAGVVSQVGDWFNTVAVFTLLKDLAHGGPLSIAWIIVIKQLPQLLLAPLAGAAADRFSKTSIMVAMDAARCMTVLGLLLSPHFSSTVFILALVALQSCLTAFFEPARSAAVPDIVRAEDLLTAGALSSFSWSICLLAGSALGGVATELFGWRGSIVLDSLSYAGSALLILSVRLARTTSAQHSQSPSRTLREDLSATVVLLRNDANLRLLTCLKGLWGVGGAMYLLLTLFGQEIYAFGSTGALGIAFLYIARGAGAMCGPITARALFSDQERHSRRLITCGVAGAALAYMLFALVHSWILAFACIFVAHFCGSIVWVYSTVLLQRATPAPFRGRIFSLELGLFTLTTSISTLVYGYCLQFDLLDVRQATTILGASWTVTILVWLVGQRSSGKTRAAAL